MDKKNDPLLLGQSDGCEVAKRAHAVTDLLHAAHGSPRHDNKDDPLDELVFIILSQMTTRWSFGRVFDRLKQTFGSWDDALASDPSDFESLIRDAGLSNQKAPRILGVLQRLRADFGRVTLEPLHTFPDAEAERYLRSLPGVGIKTAKCVLMYSLGRRVLPVDTHVWRIGKRLGLVGERMPYSRVHQALEAAVAPEDRYTFHVNAVAHGRAACKAIRPLCGSCPLMTLCDYAQSASGRR
jgi:endonuclease III